MIASKLVATVLGIGFFPKAPGTVAALAACLFFAVLKYCQASDWIVGGILVAIFIAGTLSASKVEECWGKDNGRVVIDEVLGMGIGLLFVPLHWAYYLSAFILFRAFDIGKPLYIRKLENIKGGLGVMMDDVGAGVYTNVIVQLLIYFYPQLCQLL